MLKRFVHFKYCLFIVAGLTLHPCFSWIVCGQETVNQRKSSGVGKTEMGLKEGEWLFYYPDGKLMAQENYKNGMLHGTCLAFFPNGQLASKEWWQEDLQEDSAWYFHPNGKLQRKGRYEAGVYQGLWLTFFFNGVLQQACMYLDGLPNGICKNWYDNGRLEEEGRYLDGKKQGQFIFYFREKELPRVIGEYWNDKETGWWITLNKRGKVKQLERFPENQ